MTAKQEKKLPPGIVTTAQAAKVLMVSEAWIGRLHKMEYVPKHGRGQWNLVAVFQGYIRFLKDEERRSSKSAAASRNRDVKTEMLEMQLKEKRRELVPIDDVQIVLDTAASLMQSTLMSVPSKFTRDIKERNRLDKMITTALGKIGDGMEAKMGALSEGGDVLE
jgi:phage terminase Nu1 subunit (DNA packaging protein)